MFKAKTHTRNLSKSPVVPHLVQVGSCTLRRVVAEWQHGDRVGVRMMSLQGVGADMQSRTSFGELFMELGQLATNYQFTCPAYYVLVMRSFVTLEGVAARADSSFNIYTAAVPYAVRRCVCGVCSFVGVSTRTWFGLASTIATQAVSDVSRSEVGCGRLYHLLARRAVKAGSCVPLVSLPNLTSQP